MAIWSWLPVGFSLPGGEKIRAARFAGTSWQVLETYSGGCALVVLDLLVKRWVAATLVDDSAFVEFHFGEQHLWSLTCGASQIICPVNEAKSPDKKTDAMAFALALKATRSIDPDSPLQDALYVEKLSRLLPTYEISARTDDEVVLGYWLSGGASVSAASFRRLQQVSWMGADQLRDVVVAAGFEVSEVIPGGRPVVTGDERIATAEAVDTASPGTNSPMQQKHFELAGRPDLANFFKEHVIDIVLNRDRYQALGIGFPSAIVLHGPPGCGKTYAVERLVDFLGWPSYQIDASSVASPFIHETSKKIAAVFDKAIENAPSVIVIDEMEAFLADRETGSGHHRVEEVAEFLRRIPEAVKSQVLIVAMTNRVEMIDPAILRRGRFDHVIKVDFASEPEVMALLETLLAKIPKDPHVDPRPLARQLVGRPLSDVSFVVREGARLAVRAGRAHLDQDSLLAALRSAPARDREGGSAKRSIGFI